MQRAASLIDMLPCPPIAVVLVSNPKRCVLKRGYVRAVAEDPFVAQFGELLGSYRESGGLACADNVLALLEGEVEQGLSMLARWIALRQVISFEWQGQTWLPLFQFDRRDMSIHPELAPIVAELCGVYDAWELAHWFARPNTTLDGLTPAEAFEDDAASVLQAARTDRFVIEG